jgi:hypothetical protein
MKKFFLLITALVFILNVYSTSQAFEASKILVIPIDNRSKGLSINIYPDLLNVVSSDAFDAIETIDNLSAVNTAMVDKEFRNPSLKKEYNRFLEDYRNYYIIDDGFLRKFAHLCGINKILLISGGFDTQKAFMKRNLLSYIEIPGIKSLAPSYKLVLSYTMIDAVSGSTIWQKSYSKDFAITNLSVPSQFMGENVIFAQKIRAFSQKASQKAANKILSFDLAKSNSKEVSGKLKQFNNKN